MCGLGVACGFATFGAPRKRDGETVAARSARVCDRSCGRCSGEPMLRATSDPSHQAPPLHGDLGGFRTSRTQDLEIPQIRCLSRVMHRRVPWRGVPLPDGSSLAAWTGDWSFPQFARRRSWGSTPFAGLLPPAGDRSSLIGRAHVLFSIHFIRPIDFRRADFTAREICMRAIVRAAISG
jgi:hypothetical protein